MSGKRWYRQLLKDPRWQRRRLEKFLSAGWVCERCGAADRTLHIHHKRYRRGAKPWEYEVSELECLCELCHQREHASAPNLDLSGLGRLDALLYVAETFGLNDQQKDELGEALRNKDREMA